MFRTRTKIVPGVFVRVAARGISKVVKVAKVAKVVKVVKPPESLGGFGKLLFVYVLADQTLNVGGSRLTLRGTLLQPELDVLVRRVKLYGDALGLGAIVGTSYAVG